MRQTNSNLRAFRFCLGNERKEPEPRNYRCRYYDTCLHRAAYADRDFICRGCARYEPFSFSEWQAILKKDFEGLGILWN